MPTARLPLESQAESIQTREDFTSFLGDLVDDLRAHPEQWENVTLEAYLSALGAWVGDLDGYFQNRGEPTPQEPTWSLLAAALLAARVYE